MIKRTLPLLLSLALLANMAQAAELPDLGDVASASLSPQAEQQLGESIMQQIRWKERAYLDDVELENYLNRIGQRLASASEQPSRRFTFFLVDDATLNAFAFPGGFIGVHSGLILAAESESELASVLAHEVAHVTQRHIAQILGKQGQSNMLMIASLLVAVLASNSNSQISEAALVAGQAGALQAQLGYTRSFEREADRIGVHTLEAAGFDVRGMPAFFERLQKSTRLYENNAPSYLRTHPLTQERIADMGNRVNQMRYKQVADTSDFIYVKAKLRAMQGSAVETVRALQSRLANGQTDAPTRYSLARAQLRIGKTEEAQKQIDALRETKATSPFIDLLAVEIRLAGNDAKGAIALLEPAIERYPDRSEYRYALIDALIQAGDAVRAGSLARAGTQRNNMDLRMWERLAQAEAKQNKVTAQHRALAEVYVLRGALPAAIEQLELARKANDGDFFELSAVDARMRELKSRMQEQKEK